MLSAQAKTLQVKQQITLLDWSILFCETTLTAGNLPSNREKRRAKSRKQHIGIAQTACKLESNKPYLYSNSSLDVA